MNQSKPILIQCQIQIKEVMRLLRINLIIFSAFFISISCKDQLSGEINPLIKDIFLYAEYSNPTGNSPQLSNLRFSSNIITLDNSVSTLSLDRTRALVFFNTLKIKDELGNYKAGTILTSEFTNGMWREDSENFFKSTYSQNFSLVIVVDVSSSLGDNVKTLKSTVIDAINNVFRENPAAKIGIVGFAQNIYSLQPTTNKTTIISFVNSLPENQNATRLFEAMNTGVTLLRNTVSEEKALITFTDGRNNAQSVALYENSSYISQQISNLKVQSYTIGFDGKEDVDENALKALAQNGGLYSFPKTFDDVNLILKKFTKNASSTYRMYYDRNSSPVTKPISLRIHIQALLN